VLTGPESSGKTALANLVVQHTNYPLVEEYARTYLTQIPGNYVDIDLNIIEYEQAKMEKQYNDKTHVICDTDLLTIFIWRSEVFKYCDLNWADRLRSNQYGLDRIYFLCKPDIPWQYDVLRENPYDRERIYDVYKNILEKFKLNFIILEGSLDAKIASILSVLS
jgi:nicotinamide riboside kinase